MRSDVIVIASIGSQDPAQMRLAQNDKMIHTLAPHRSDQPFGKAILRTMARSTKTTMASARAMVNPTCKIRTRSDFERIEFRAIAVNLTAVFLSKIQIMVEPLIQKERKGLITYERLKNLLRLEM